MSAAENTQPQPATDRFLVARLGDEPVTVTGVGELHDLLTDWFADAPLEQLTLVDDLALAIESNKYDQHRLAVNLGVDVDRIGDEPIEQADAAVIPLFPGVTVDTPAAEPAAEPAPVDEVDPNHWSRRLPTGNGLSVYAGIYAIPCTAAAAIVVGLAIRALNGGAL